MDLNLYCDNCHYINNIHDIDSVFIDDKNLLICNICKNKLIDTNAIIYVKTNVEEHYRSTNLYVESKYECKKCNKIFISKYTEDLHFYKKK